MHVCHHNTDPHTDHLHMLPALCVTVFPSLQVSTRFSAFRDITFRRWHGRFTPNHCSNHFNRNCDPRHYEYSD